MISVIFPAAGKGKRMGLGYNKIFMDLKGKPIFLQTMLKFSACEIIDELILVAESTECEGLRALIESVEGLKPCKVVAGGKERQDSVYNGVKAVSPKADIILVHDAARPLVNEEIIYNVITAVRETGAAICAVPVKDTICRVDENLNLIEVPDRSVLWGIQTPQGFKRDLLIKAEEAAKAEKFLGTDESSLVRRIGHPVKVVMGSYTNIKITTKSDVACAELWFNESGQENEDSFKLSPMVDEFLTD